MSARPDWSWKPPAQVAQAIRRGDAKTHWKAVAARYEREPIGVTHVFVGGRAAAETTGKRGE